MKYFKTKASRTALRYEISSENFSRQTGHKQPFEQRRPDRSLAQYGICPSCLNPIQLIGIDRKIKYTPYGRHAGKDIAGLPKWSLLRYQYCPFAQKNDRRDINEDERLIDITDDVIELYNLLKAQFDRVVYIISCELGIVCTSAFWSRALQQYIASQGYCYPWLTEANLPYIFAYIGMQHSQLLGQRFLVGTDLFQTISKHTNANFICPKDKSGNIIENSNYRILTNKNGYLNLQFRFTNHKQRAVQGETLNESMLCCVDDMQTGETIFEKRLEFNENFFMNMVNKKGNEDKRQQWLFNIADKLMPELT